MNDNQILIHCFRSVQFDGFDHVTQHSCIDLLSESILFTQIIFQIMPHLAGYVHFGTLIGSALRVSRTKGYSFKSWTCFSWSLKSMGELASIMRIVRHFLITNANSFHWLQAPLYRCPRFEWIPFCPAYSQCKPYEGCKLYIALCEMWQNLKRFFEKNGLHDNRTL